MEAIAFLAAPFAMCLILVGIHCYLGLHVIRRGVIFVDLSLAQVASLGSTVALLFHFEHASTGSYFISLLFTFVASAYFAWGKNVEGVVSQEVLIAIVYAFSSALVILIVNSMAHGSEHIKEILIGKILWVTWSDVFKTGTIYFLVALVHYYFRNIMFKISNNETVKRPLLWDFLFYALFGVVITSSVGIAGILLVFSFLVVPSLISMIFCQTVKSQLLFGWGLGIILCLLGMLVSFKYDLPAGAVLVTVFTFCSLLVIPFSKKFKRA